MKKDGYKEEKNNRSVINSLASLFVLQIEEKIRNKKKKYDKKPKK